MEKTMIGVDKSNGNDCGVITGGYWIDGVFHVVESYVLTMTPEECKNHDFAATDDVMDYCIHCGTTRPTQKKKIEASADNIIHIVAGNVRQAKEFARRHGIYPKYWAFLSNPKEVRGLAGSVVYTGTFYQRPDIHEIEQEVKFNPRLKVLDTDG